MFSMNNLEKTNLLFNKKLLQFYYIFKFKCIYIIQILYISILIDEFKPKNFSLLIFGRLFICIAHDQYHFGAMIITLVSLFERNCTESEAVPAFNNNKGPGLFRENDRMLYKNTLFIIAFGTA